jgi:hypothetical protein
LTLCVSLAHRNGAAQLDDVTGDSSLTVEQCINDNTDASIKPREKKILVEAGIIEEQLGDMTVTEEVCGEIVARTPDGSRVERLIAARNVTEEIDVIRESMTEAFEGDVDGDGVVDAQDARTASAASYAAARTAEKTVRNAIDEDGGQIGVIEEIKALPAAYLQNVAQDQYGGDGGGGGGGAGDGVVERLPSPEKVQVEAVSAARDRGAGRKAAVAGGDCATDVALIDGTYLSTVKGNIAFEAPAKQMLWKDRDVSQRVAATVNR